MKKSRFSETQFVSILKTNEAGRCVVKLYKERGISRRRSIYNWHSKTGRMDASLIKRLREAEAENSKLNRMYADLSLENDALNDLIEKKF